jgi:hypothetical protein
MHQQTTWKRTNMTKQPSQLRAFVERVKPPARWAACLAPALLAVMVPLSASSATLSVGPGQPYRTVASAVAAARDGDVVQVQAGTYTNDFPVAAKNISIVGIGGMARLVANTAIPNGKGILIARGNVTVQSIEFAGAQVADRNGAGIRYEGGNLSVRKCYFHDNQNGILANPAPTGNVYIYDAEFARNGYGDGYTHGVYVNRIASLNITNSYFHDTKVGHHIKSRATSTVLNGNRIVDGTNGTASYSVDVPNGGYAVLTGNNIVQSATSQNPAMIHFGGESAPYSNSSLQVMGNVLQNHRSSAVGVLNHTSIVATINRNNLYRLPSVASGPSNQSANMVLTAPVTVDTSSPWRD